MPSLSWWSCCRGIRHYRNAPPLSSFRLGNESRVWRYTEALEKLRQVLAKARDDPSEVALYPVRIGAATTLVDGGEGRRG